ncbi:MAG: zinc transporter [Desulfuromonadales bacterium]
MDFFMQLNPVTQALLATLFTWALTAAGAALVFMKKDDNPSILDMILGFAAGAMIFVVVEELIPESQ